MNEIKLTKNKVALIDSEDFERISNFKWYYDARGYAVRTQNNKKPHTIAMHRFVLNITDSKIQVDHINGNTIDNRKENLRVANYVQNGSNRKPNKNKKYSKYKGVSKTKPTDPKWRVIIHCKNKKIEVGTYISELEAAKAYDKAAMQYHGEFARLNFPKVSK